MARLWFPSTRQWMQYVVVFDKVVRIFVPPSPPQSRALESGCGLKENPLQIVWTSGKPSTASVSKSCAGNESPLERGEDYERITLMRLRQAQERKRLAEEIQREDKEEDKTLVEQLETKDNT